ncbi:DMT family transporter [Methylococcus sp. EFPC2]|uniref:DMT family transporter n=1 Tax=Methylococcus sp. EFPC2 TaxID=2812648 RepID=UPI001967E1E9|nr:DMT family transporter [Methylococcus sp. EFPC2]QSA96340.1 DMT family transporter [Methylococcus sp. EFPC2]
MQENFRRGWITAFLGIGGFSLTMPATRLAVLYLDPWFVALGRGVLAGGLALATLLIARPPLPGREHVVSLAVVALGAVVGFPLLSAWGLQDVPASHAGITISVTPLFTALLGARLAGERLPGRFWMAALVGTAAVFGFVLHAGGGRLGLSDAWLFGASLAAAVSYAEGARLARILGGWQVICWALVLAAPWLALPLAWIAAHAELSAPVEAWAGFVYVAVVSQFVAFMLWHRGLALGGIARISQIQLLQPFLTLGACALWLGESVTGTVVAVAAVVASSLWVSQRSARRRPEYA